MKKGKFNFAYKCFTLDDGVVFLFENIFPFEDQEIDIKIIDGEVYLEMGNNVALLTPAVREQLLKTPNIYLSACKFYDYEGKFESYFFTVNEKALAKIEGVIEALKVLQENNKQSVV